MKHQMNMYSVILYRIIQYFVNESSTNPINAYTQLKMKESSE